MTDISDESRARGLAYAIHAIRVAPNEADIWRSVEMAAAALRDVPQDDPVAYLAGVYLQELARALTGDRRHVRNAMPVPDLTLAEAFGFVPVKPSPAIEGLSVGDEAGGTAA